MSEGLPTTIEDLIEEYGIDEVIRKFNAALQVRRGDDAETECEWCGELLADCVCDEEDEDDDDE